MGNGVQHQRLELGQIQMPLLKVLILLGGISHLSQFYVLGVYGRTIYGEIDIPLSSWGHYPDRFSWTECTIAVIPNSNQVSKI